MVLLCLLSWFPPSFLPSIPTGKNAQHSNPVPSLSLSTLTPKRFIECHGFKYYLYADDFQTCRPFPRIPEIYDHPCMTSSLRYLIAKPRHIQSQDVVVTPKSAMSSSLLLMSTLSVSYSCKPQTCLLPSVACFLLQPSSGLLRNLPRYIRNCLASHQCPGTIILPLDCCKHLLRGLSAASFVRTAPTIPSA